MIMVILLSFTLQGNHFMKQYGILKVVQMLLITMLVLHLPSVESTSSFLMGTLLTLEESH